MMMENSKYRDNSMITHKQKEIDVTNESENLLVNEDVDASVWQLVNTLKMLEKEEAYLLEKYGTKYSDLQAEVTFLEKEVANGTSDVNVAQVVDRFINASADKLYSAKMELASVLRETLKLKKKIDSFPVQSELIQYELRTKELNGLIQEKHCQTRNLYATYNALLEIKELLVKEISLLNSINSQFHDAITSPAGQMKLIGSMEGILKGTQQKLKKAELEIQKEQKSCYDVKEMHAAAASKQRQFYSLLKMFQEECTINERLRTAQTPTKLLSS